MRRFAQMMVLLFVASLARDFVLEKGASIYDVTKEESADYNKAEAARADFQLASERIDTLKGVSALLDWDAGGIALTGIPRWNDEARVPGKASRAARHVVAAILTVFVFLGLGRLEGRGGVLRALSTSVVVGFALQQLWQGGRPGLVWAHWMVAALAVLLILRLPRDRQVAAVFVTPLLLNVIGLNSWNLHFVARMPIGLGLVVDPLLDGSVLFFFYKGVEVALHSGGEFETSPVPAEGPLPAHAVPPAHG